MAGLAFLNQEPSFRTRSQAAHRQRRAEHGKSALPAGAVPRIAQTAKLDRKAAAVVRAPSADDDAKVILGYSPRDAGLHGLAPVFLYLTIFPVSIFNGLATAFLGAGPLGEEGGWRGYLLPRLLEDGGEVRASLIIGIVWALWHMPIMAMFPDWRGGVSFETYLPLYTIGVIGLSFVMSRVWLIGEGSLVPCIWLHALVNALGGVAFNHSVWTSRWSVEAGTGHFAIATALTAAFLLWIAHRKRQV